MQLSEPVGPPDRLSQPPWANASLSPSPDYQPCQTRLRRRAGRASVNTRGQYPRCRRCLSMNEGLCPRLLGGSLGVQPDPPSPPPGGLPLLLDDRVLGEPSPAGTDDPDPAADAERPVAFPTDRQPLARPGVLADASATARVPAMLRSHRRSPG